MSPAWAQTAAPPDSPQSSAATQSTRLPVDLSRIREGLDRPAPEINLNDGRLRFFAQVTEKEPWFEKFTLGFNFRSGLVPGAGMTHQEFLNQVTPKYLYGSGGITALEQLEWGVVNYVAIWTVKRLYKELSEARTEWRRKQIQEQIDRELAALKGGK